MNLCLLCVRNEPHDHGDIFEPLSLTTITVRSEPYRGELPKGALDRIHEHLKAELDRLISEALVCGR